MSLEEYREKVKSGEIEASPRTNPEERFIANPTRKNAINAFCFECMGKCEGYTSEIRKCSAKNCPLYSFRPYK